MTVTPFPTTTNNGAKP